jgi:hypothetical protein
VARCTIPSLTRAMSYWVFLGAVIINIRPTSMLRLPGPPSQRDIHMRTGIDMDVGYKMGVPIH